MWHLLTIILAIIGSILAWAGELTIGMLCVIPLFIMYVVNEMRLNLKKK